MYVYPASQVLLADLLKRERLVIVGVQSGVFDGGLFLLKAFAVLVKAYFNVGIFGQEHVYEVLGLSCLGLER